jgi:hypothetical protein
MSPELHVTGTPLTGTPLTGTPLFSPHVPFSPENSLDAFGTQ